MTTEEIAVRVAQQPRLYDPATDVPVLAGVQCRRCDQVYFPPIAIGCEMCGADQEQLTPKPLAASGIVFAIADVHVGPTPYTVAEIILDSGPLIRAIMHPDAGPVEIGKRVCAHWHVSGQDNEGSEIVQPAFMATDRVTA